MLQPSGTSTLHVKFICYPANPISNGWMNEIEREATTKKKTKINLLMNMEMYLLNHLILITFIVSLLICRNKNTPEFCQSDENGKQKRKKTKEKNTQSATLVWTVRSARRRHNEEDCIFAHRIPLIARTFLCKYPALHQAPTRNTHTRGQCCK